MAFMQLPIGAFQVRTSAYCSSPHCFCRLCFLTKKSPKRGWKRVLAACSKAESHAHESVTAYECIFSLTQYHLGQESSILFLG